MRVAKEWHMLGLYYFMLAKPPAVAALEHLAEMRACYVDRFGVDPPALEELTAEQAADKLFRAVLAGKPDYDMPRADRS